MNVDVANNIKAIELIKVDILQSITNLFTDLLSEADSDVNNVIAEDAANIICLSYLLCKRIGIDYKTVNKKAKSKIYDNIKNHHSLEKKFSDLSQMLEDVDF